MLTMLVQTIRASNLGITIDICFPGYCSVSRKTEKFSVLLKKAGMFVIQQGINVIAKQNPQKDKINC